MMPTRTKARMGATHASGLCSSASCICVERATCRSWKSNKSSPQSPPPERARARRRPCDTARKRPAGPPRCAVALLQMRSSALCCDRPATAVWLEDCSQWLCTARGSAVFGSGNGDRLLYRLCYLTSDRPGLFIKRPSQPPDHLRNKFRHDFKHWKHRKPPIKKLVERSLAHARSANI